MMLESFKHGESSFVTLTYDPKNYDGKTLVPKHTQDWLKRLRKAVAPTNIRYFLVGEYGDETQRPHYHAALFGLGLDSGGIIDQTWGRGFTYTGDLTPDSASYIAGYVSKKLNGRDKPCDQYPRGRSQEILNGRHPEFARMSLRPGIGATALTEIVDVLTTEHGCDELSLLGDVPHQLRCGKKSLPLGRYLRSKLRERLNFTQNIFNGSRVPAVSVKRYEEEMLQLFKEERSKKDYKRKTNAEIIVEKNAQAMLNLETRMKIHRGKKL